MTQSQVELESLTTELTAGAFNAFAQDISSMFDTAVSVEQLDIAAGTIKQLKNTYKKLAAVCSVKAEGALKGQFYVVFGTEGLFTLAGTFAKQSKQIIKKNLQSGTKVAANELADAVAEVNNLMVGAWDRVFLEEMPDHKHFVQSGTFIGNPWVKSEEKIALAAETELVILTFEMTIKSMPAFKCGIIYPKLLFEPSSDEAVADAEAGADAEVAGETPAKEAPAGEVAEEPAAEEPAGDDRARTEQGAPEVAAQASAEDNSDVEVTAEKTAADGPSTDEPSTESSAQKAAPENESAGEVTNNEGTAEGSAKKEAGTDDTVQETGSEPAAEEDASTDESGTDQAATEASATEKAQSGPENTAEEDEQPTEVREDSAQQEPGSEQPPGEQDEQQEASEQLPQPEECEGGPVTDSIAKMTHSEALLPGQFADCSGILTGLTAKNVMTTDIVWATADEAVEQLFAKMQQNDTAYLLIGEKAHLEGIVSKSDIRGALSPYLQSMFSKWRTSMDIATLQIKAQWIMSRPVRTVRPEATLASVMQVMSEFGGRCLPVSDEGGKVHGIVTVFDIFGALLTCACSVSTSGKADESPPMV